MGLMRFEFATATRILFGAGTVREVAPQAAALGRRALVVTGVSAERPAPVLHALKELGVQADTLAVEHEPDVEGVLAAVKQARAQQIEVVIGMGGGSALDTGKAIAALLTNQGNPFDYLEVVGRGQPLANPSAPYIAVPTTAGTGSEVTRNAVLGVPQKRVKVSLRSPLMLPRLAVVDPELTYSLPPAQTASTGLDAFTQVLEPYVSNSANPLTDGICREGMMRAARSLRRAYENGKDAAAREDMSLVSLFGGLALANARLGAVHGFAGPLGGWLSAPHGAICARLLPFVIRVNIRALEARAPRSPSLARYGEIARLLTGRADAQPCDAADWVQALCNDLSIPSLSQLGLSRADLEPVAAQAAQSSSMKGNPITLTSEEQLEILEQAL